MVTADPTVQQLSGFGRRVEEDRNRQHGNTHHGALTDCTVSAVQRERVWRDGHCIPDKKGPVIKAAVRRAIVKGDSRAMVAAMSNMDSTVSL